MEHRYEKNTIFRPQDQEILGACTAAVIGCGGLGGYLAEMLARLGIGHLILCDGDVFDETNLNRQLMCTEKNLGQNKAEASKLRLSEINSSTEVAAVSSFLDGDNGPEMLENCDIVLDGLDCAADKLMLQEICSKLEIPLIHGAADGWFGQIAAIYPGENLLTELYSSEPEEMSCPSFTPAVIAGMMVSETVKVLLGCGEKLQRKVRFIDLLNGDINEAEI